LVLLAWRNRVVWAQQVLLVLLARRIGLGARFWSRLIRLQSGNLRIAGWVREKANDTARL
jgi:hypothetical protein